MSKHIAHFMSTIMKKGFSNFSWGSAYDVPTLSKTTISLPITSEGAINYDFMEKFTSAMQKVTIKNVIEYLDLRLDKTKEITDKN